MLGFQDISENMDEYASPPRMFSLIDVQENKDQEAFISLLSKGGALFLF
jgi:hypothetical protein